MANSIAAVRTLAMAAVVQVTLTACGGSSSGVARTLPPVTTRPTTSVSAQPVPSGIAAPTPEGASQFARYFYAQITHAFATKDPSLIEAISLPTCKTCALYAGSVALVRAKNQRVQGGEFAITFAASPPDAKSLSSRVDIGWNFAGATFYDSSGKVIERHPPQRGVEEQVQLLRSGDRWVVAEVTRVRTRG